MPLHRPSERFLYFDFICQIDPLACFWPPTPVGASNALSMCDVLGLCFVPAPSPTSKLFGFAEFVQAFALLVLIYTMSDVRYRFRAATAPLPIWPITFWLCCIIGFGTLATDLWFANGFPILSFLTNQTYWQFAFGLLFIAAVLLWLWYAYLRPPVFGRRNAERFLRQLYIHILQGAESEMPVIAAELRRSAWSIVKYATITPHRRPPALVLSRNRYSLKRTSVQTVFCFLSAVVSSAVTSLLPPQSLRWLSSEP